MENQSNAELKQKASALALLKAEHDVKQKELEQALELKVKEVQKKAEVQVTEMKQQIFNLRRQFEDQQTLQAMRLQEKDCEIDRMGQLLSQLQL